MPECGALFHSDLDASAMTDRIVEEMIVQVHSHLRTLRILKVLQTLWMRLQYWVSRGDMPSPVFWVVPGLRPTWLR